MSVPKSVVKTKVKNGNANIMYEDFSAQTEYYLFELSRAGLRDVGKFIKKLWKNVYYTKFVKHTGMGGKVTNFKVESGKNTKDPNVRIGLKYGKIDGFYAYFQEFGTSKTPRLGLLKKAVEEHIADIVTIESQYLSGLSGTAEALNSQISEEEYEEDD